ncbi:MAG: ribosome silencing factor [Chloroflexi bacterium]|nr:ribosome silencing factor [Chloroflexota bacterium]
MESAEIARKAVEAASDKQAADVLMLDTRQVCDFADYFVVCSGESEPQIQAIVEEVSKALRESGVRPRGREGTADSGWVLLDYGDVVVHIFSSEKRALYRLEDLWSRASPVLRLA